MALTEYASLTAAPKANSENHPIMHQDELSVLNEMLDQIQLLHISTSPNRLQYGSEYGDFYDPPITHLVASVEDLTDALDYVSEELEGMDKEAEEPTPTHTWRWTSIWWTRPVTTVTSHLSQTMTNRGRRIQGAERSISVLRRTREKSLCKALGK